jgi:hypothetical protein
VNVHLRPGSIIAYQNNSLQLHKTTKDIQDKQPISLIINRDIDGHASGKLFLDRGESISELNKHEFDYYQFFMSGNKTITKWVLNEGHNKCGLKVDKIVITLAKNLRNTIGGCVSSIIDGNKLENNFTTEYDTVH